MFVGIMMIKWIKPSELGLWQSISIIQLYVPILEMGIPNGLNRELPYEYGKNNINRANALAQTSQYFMIAVAILFFVFTVSTVITLQVLSYEVKTIAGVFSVGILLSINAYQRYLTVTFRSNQSFINLSKVYLYYCLIQVVLFPLVYFFNYYGLLLYTVLCMILLTLIMHAHRPILNKPLFNIILFKELIKTGLPIFIINYLRGILQSFNRIILLKYGGVISVGLFTPVQSVNTLINIVPGVLGNFLFPKFNYELGKTNNPKVLWPSVLKINFSLLLFGIPIILIVNLVAYDLIFSFFPNYTNAVLAIKIFSFAFLFSGTLVSHTVIYSLKSYKIAYLYIAIELILSYGLPVLFIYLNVFDLLSNVAAGFVLSQFFLFGLNLIFIRKVIFNK
jgi:O-antigen/teichoic acid export membrane protein